MKQISGENLWVTPRCSTSMSSSLVSLVVLTQSFTTSQQLRMPKNYVHLHLKFLTSDYLTNERMSIDQPTISPACKLCNAPTDSIEHVMVSCLATSEVRSRLFPELMNEVAKVQPMCSILQYHPPPSILTQFILIVHLSIFLTPSASQCTTLASQPSTKSPEIGIFQSAMRDPVCSEAWLN